MKLKKSILIVLFTSAAVIAQGPPPPGGPGFGRHMAGGPGGMGHKVVTGAPYTADINSTNTRTLADGNVIQNTTTGKVARDASGRTYTMETSTGGPLGPITHISIFDPVAGYAYELDPTTKTATRRQIRQGGGQWTRQAPPENPNVVKADLGTKPVNGVNAQGTSRTRTIKAGTVGNLKDLVSTTETWYSPELQTVIASTRNDPQVGQSVYALTNIQTSADPSLFQVPAGYTITDAPRGPRGQLFSRHPNDVPPPPPQEEY